MIRAAIEGAVEGVVHEPVADYATRRPRPTPTTLKGSINYPFIQSPIGGGRGSEQASRQPGEGGLALDDVPKTAADARCRALRAREARRAIGPPAAVDGDRGERAQSYSGGDRRPAGAVRSRAEGGESCREGQRRSAGEELARARPGRARAHGGHGGRDCHRERDGQAQRGWDWRGERDQRSGRRSGRGERAASADPGPAPEGNDLAGIGRAEWVVREAVEGMGAPCEAVQAPRHGGRDAAHWARAKTVVKEVRHSLETMGTASCGRRPQVRPTGRARSTTVVP